MSKLLLTAFILQELNAAVVPVAEFPQRAIFQQIGDVSRIARARRTRDCPLSANPTDPVDRSDDPLLRGLLDCIRKSIKDT